MNIFNRLNDLLGNDPLELKDVLFEKNPAAKPDISLDKLERFQISLIIGEHPSDYALSPVLWNSEYFLCHRQEFFLPADIKEENKENLFRLLDFVLEATSRHFRVLTVTNPHKIEALNYLSELANRYPEKVIISEDARRIGATNQILIGPDDVFHVINSDGRGMANAIESFMSARKESGLAGKNVGVIGAGGAARGIIYELARRIGGSPGGSLTIFNRTLEKAVVLSREFASYFPDLEIRVEPLDQLSASARGQDLLVSSITEGDPLFDKQIYAKLPEGMLLVDANYGTNSKLREHAELSGRKDLEIHDGGGMVVEGYIIPSEELAMMWGYEVPFEIYQKIGKMFNYSPKE